MSVFRTSNRKYAVRCKPLRRQRRQLPYQGSLNNELKFSEITPNKGTEAFLSRYFCLVHFDFRYNPKLGDGNPLLLVQTSSLLKISEITPKLGDGNPC